MMNRRKTEANPKKGKKERKKEMYVIRGVVDVFPRGLEFRGVCVRLGRK